ncbi:tetratricopeptide repeat protein [Dysgonomonas sp. 25]|uniref:tetratricopeptide repeat protein n=1 Tax=Dysgonomonas sp. 25 TaxID=2302933 RepID=UPI0013D4DAC7|nr:tetratricopeptide repeat protein [Dysgonomonas sp. 25]NDV68884.1 hypothetical protein [Dysgonomonas sp. 25]
MSSKKKQAEIREEKDWERIDQAVVKSENFLERYSKQILGVIAVGVIAACAYLAYQHFYATPRSLESEKAIAQGQLYYEMGRDSLALYGDANAYAGFEKIAADYSSTKTGNLANAYAGICHARLGNYEKALEYLNAYSNSGDKVFSHLIDATKGDCLVSTGKQKEAIALYEKAAKAVDNNVQSPILYKKAALLYREQGNHDKVIELFTFVKDNYMNSSIAMMEADKYIEEAKLLKGK